MSSSIDRLYDLLPAIYRMRDAENGYPLRALMRIISEQVNIVEDDIAQLYDNWFIETCEDWVVPYIGDLIGYLPVHEVGEPEDVSTPRERLRNRILTSRKDVARTIGYRRRKGTLALLEELADSAAGWPARAVEFYKLLGWTQHLNHQHPLRGRIVDLRQGDALDRLDGPFDELAHTVDIRRPTSSRTQGLYNIPSIGVFVWRLKSYSVTQTPAYCLEDIGPQCYTFSVLGNDTPLYNLPQPETEPTHIANERNLPTPISRRAFEDRIIVDGEIKRTQASDSYYGKSLTICAKGWLKKGSLKAIPRERIIPADLSDWKYETEPGYVAVDPVLGRMIFPENRLPKHGVEVSYQYAFSADIGGGEYDRIIPQPDVLAISMIHFADFRDLNALSSRLKTLDPVTTYMREHFSPSTLELLDSSQPKPEELQSSLVSEFNKIIEDVNFYDESRFPFNDLPEEAKMILKLGTKGQQPLRFNRLLLESEFKEEIVKSFKIYRVGRQEPGRDINVALTEWCNDQPRYAIIEITDSNIYVEQINVRLGENQSLQIQAANLCRPVIRLLDWHTSQPDSFSIEGAKGSRFVLDGLLITGRGIQVNVPEFETECQISTEDLCEVAIRHSTLVPGWTLDSDCEAGRPNEPSIELMDTRAKVRIEHSIIGTIQVVSNEIKTDPIKICISDSILDATSPDKDALCAPNGCLAHAVLNVIRCTVLGQVLTQAIDVAEDSIFYGILKVARSQIGCMRFCYVTPGSRPPRRYDCQPDLAERAETEGLKKPYPSDEEKDAARQSARQIVRPKFNSTRYGTPTYCQLAGDCAPEIKRGAEDESEMGAFHDLYQPQREANLRSRLYEYTPASMNAGIKFMS
jgi:hypothetical protein